MDTLGLERITDKRADTLDAKRYSLHRPASNHSSTLGKDMFRLRFLEETISEYVEPAKAAASRLCLNVTTITVPNQVVPS